MEYPTLNGSMAQRNEMEKTTATPLTDDMKTEVEKKEDSGPSSPSASITQDAKTSSSPSALGRIWDRLAELPEWGFRGEKLSGAVLNYSIGFIATCGFLMFGYDQGVLSALLTLDDFQRVLPMMTPRDEANDLCWIGGDRDQPDPNMCTGTPDTQAAGVAIYQIGCFLGAVLILFYGERWGRKPSTFWGSLIMVSCLTFPDFQYIHADPRL